MTMKQVFSFRGQYTRKQFWLTQLGILIFVISTTTLTLLYLGYEGDDFFHDSVSDVVGFFSLFTLWPALASWAKRFRDLDKSPYFALLFFIPIVSFFAFWHLGCTETKKRSTS